MNEKQKQIMDYIMSNKIINNFLDKVPIDDRDDFKQYFYLTILEALNHPTKFKKLSKLFDHCPTSLGKYCTMIIHNSRQKQSPYGYKKKRIKIVEFKNIEMTDTKYEEIETRSVIDQIVRELNHLNYYDQVMFKLYYGIDPVTNEVSEKRTYKDIEKVIGINWQYARLSVIQTLKYIQEKIQIKK